MLRYHLNTIFYEIGGEVNKIRLRNKEVVEVDHEMAISLATDAISSLVSLVYYRVADFTSRIDYIQFKKKSIVIKFKEDK